MAVDKSMLSPSDPFKPLIIIDRLAVWTFFNPVTQIVQLEAAAL